MKAISTQQQAERTELVRALNDCAENVRNAIIAVNDALAGPCANLDTTVTAHNSAATALKEFLDGLASAAEDYIEDRSDRWRESDAGANYAESAGSLREAADSISEIDEDAFHYEKFAEPDLFNADTWVHPPNTPDR